MCPKLEFLLRIAKFVLELFLEYIIILLVLITFESILAVFWPTCNVKIKSPQKPRPNMIKNVIEVRLNWNEHMEHHIDLFFLSLKYTFHLFYFEFNDWFRSWAVNWVVLFLTNACTTIGRQIQLGVWAWASEASLCVGARVGTSTILFCALIDVWKIKY